MILRKQFKKISKRKLIKDNNFLYMEIITIINLIKYLLY